MKNLFLFAGKSDFGIHLASNLKQFFTLVEHFDTFAVPLNKKPYFLIKSFSPNKTNWRDNYYSLRSKYDKNPNTFIKKSHKLKQYLRELNLPVDIILQCSSLFDSTMESSKIPHAVYIDYTTSMAIRDYPEWAPFEDKVKSNKWIELETNLYRSTDLIMTFNAAAGESVSNDYGIDKGKVVVVGSGSSITEIPDIEKDYGKKKILFCGRDFKRHGGDIVLKAFKIIKDKFPEAELLIVGLTVKDNLDGVTYINHLSIEKLHEKMLESTVLAMPARVGGLQSMTEAMAYKCVCIAAGGNIHIDNLITNEETGILMQENNENILAREVIRLFSDRDFLIRLSRQGQQHVKEFYTWEGVCRKIAANLKILIDKY